MAGDELPPRKLRPKVWFTGNLRLGCLENLSWAGRAFLSIEERDHFLIVNWNEVVHPDDHVWVLGDFCSSRPGLADMYLEQLNGSKNLVIGDRDTVGIRRAQGWEYVDWFTKILLEDQWVYVSHFPLHDRPEAGRELSLFAHSEGDVRDRRSSCHVGSEQWDFRPTSLAEISRRLAQFTPGLDPQPRPSRLRR